MGSKKRAPKPPKRRFRHRPAAANRVGVVSYEVTTEPLYEVPENKVPPELARPGSGVHAAIGSGHVVGLVEGFILGKARTPGREPSRSHA